MIYNLRRIAESMYLKQMMNIEGHIGLVRSIQMEDGSGRNYNIGMLVGGKTITVFIKAELPQIERTPPSSSSTELPF